MYKVNQIKKRKFYHLAKLITRIDETKFMENIVVDQKHDLTRLLPGGWEDSFDNDILELVINELTDDEILIGTSVLTNAWFSFAGYE